MIQTIRVERVLRETVVTPYRVLVTRPTGAAVRARIEQVLAGSQSETALLDFVEVELLDFSCADEVVAKLLMTDALQSRFLLLRLHCDDQWDAIDQVLSRQGLAVAALRAAAPRPSLLGHTTDDLRDAFNCLCLDGPADAGQLAMTLRWPHPRAAAALAGLVQHRLARPTGAVHYPPPLPRA